MIYLVVVLCSLISLMGMQLLEQKRGSIVRAAVFSLVYYFGLYTIISGILFWIRQFYVSRAVILVLIVSFVLCVLSARKNGIKELEIVPEKKDAWIPYLAILLLCIFTAGHFEFFGMGQDQGVYQVEAINLFYNSTDWRHSIAEYDELEEGEYKDYYQNEVGSRAGFDLLKGKADIPGCKVDNTASELLGMWHGIPTFASILALSAKIFGIKHMMYIQVLFYICFLFVIAFLLADLRVGVYLRTLCVILSGISPQLIWVKKASLTEMFLALLFVVYLYFMLHKEENRKILAVFPVTVFCFFHVTVFTMMPIFVLNFWYLFLSTGHKKYLKCVGGILGAYAMGFFMMWMVQPSYTLLNYHQGLFFIPLKLIPGFVVAVCVLTGAVTILLGKKVKKTVNMENVLKQMFRYISLVVVLFVLAYAVVNHYALSQVSMMTIMCYAILTGVLLLPVLLGIFIVKKYEFNPTIGILGLTFSWCILAYSILMKRDIAYYYYYGRYLAPYLCIIILLGAYFLKGKRRICQSLPLIGILILLPFANVLRVNQDDSKMEWSVLSDVMESAQGSQGILLDSDLMGLLYYPLRASSGGKVYPVKDSVEATINDISSGEDKYLYITNKSLVEEPDWMRIVYRDKAHFQEDNLINVFEVLGLPSDITYKGTYEITAYQVEPETKSISADDDNARFQGWAGTDAGGFRWNNEKEAFVKCYLDKKDYTMTIRNGNLIPFEQISVKDIAVKIYLNENYIQTIHYTADTRDTDWEVKLPAELVSEGSDMIKFECDTLWSPAEYGSADESNYGFSIRAIEFEQTGEK